jgi:Na+-transporting NADH:ubiquinone oxidoreductase subunit NqrB
MWLPALSVGGEQGFLSSSFSVTVPESSSDNIVSYVSGLGGGIHLSHYPKHEVNEGYLVSGMLIPLVMPVDIPLWMVAVASIFAVILGKEAFGGTGMNVFNPALLARAFIFFAYPAKITGDAIWTAGLTKGEGVIDGFSGATPLSRAASGAIDKIPSMHDLFFGFIPAPLGKLKTTCHQIERSHPDPYPHRSWRHHPVGVRASGMTRSSMLLAANTYKTIEPLTQ